MTQPAMTAQHRLVVLAALRFWRDEMEPHDQKLVATYLGHKFREPELPNAEDVAWIADNFNRFRLRYAAVSRDGDQLIEHRLFANPEAARHAIGTTEGRIGTLLVLPDDNEGLHAGE